MKFRFEKSAAPKVLRDWIADEEQRRSPWNEFGVKRVGDKADGENIKAKVRTQLHSDQRGLCCYCYARTGDDHRSHIEHIEAQSDENRYEWQNLALACEGGNTGHNPRHCDHSKGDQPLLRIHPYRNPVRMHVRLGGKGQLKPVSGADTESWWQKDIEKVLNLNADHLKRLRSAARDAALADLGGARRRRARGWRPRDLRSMHAEVCDRLRDKRPADYDPLVLDWLERRMAR